MANISVISLEEGLVPPAMDSARIKFDESEFGAVLDFSLIERLDSSSLTAVRELSQRARDGHSKVILRGMNVEVYKALKLAKLTSGLSFSD